MVTRFLRGKEDGQVPRKGIAVAAACTSCAAQIGGGQLYEPGRHMALICLRHAGELEADGWTIVHDLYGQHGRTDLFCPHIPPP